MRPLLLIAFACIVAPATASDICKYRDRDGAEHFSNLPPESGWSLLFCSEGPDPTKAVDRAAQDERDWTAARAKIKVGMTYAQMRAADPLLVYVDARKTAESASGKVEWIKYRHFEVVLRNGRVAKIIY